MAVGDLDDPKVDKRGLGQVRVANVIEHNQIGMDRFTAEAERGR